MPFTIPSRRNTERIFFTAKTRTKKKQMRSLLENQKLLTYHLLVHAKILDSLKYQTMETCYEDVMEAYPKTLDWAFDGFAINSTRRRFGATLGQFSRLASCRQRHLLDQQKAAPGKSILMKYTHGNPKTQKYLDKWTGDVLISLATFFF